MTKQIAEISTKERDRLLVWWNAIDNKEAFDDKEWATNSQPVSEGSDGGIEGGMMSAYASGQIAEGVSIGNTFLLSPTMICYFSDVVEISAEDLYAKSEEWFVEEFKSDVAVGYNTEYVSEGDYLLDAWEEIIDPDIVIMDYKNIGRVPGQEDKHYFIYWAAIPPINFVTSGIIGSFSGLYSPTTSHTNAIGMSSELMPHSQQQNATKGDIAYRNTFGNPVVHINLANIQVYSTIVKSLFKTLQEKIEEYQIQFDRPLDLTYIANDIGGLYSALASAANVPSLGLDPTMFIRFEFDKDFETLLNLKSISRAGPEAAAGEATATEPTEAKIEIRNVSRFSFSQTNNFLIYSLATLYNKYVVSANLNTSFGNVFLGEDEIRQFLNKYILPAPSLVTSQLTRTVLEKYILGDVRLLDDEYYQKYKPKPEHMPAAFKQSLNQEISQQYEAIGDLMGEKFIRGEFKEIHSVDEIFDAVVDHISIPDLTKLAAKCLMKMIDLKAALDYICKDILEQYDKHLESIIGWLEDMDDGVAKDIAKELTQLYFEMLQKGEKYTGSIMKSAVKTYIPYALEQWVFFKASLDWDNVDDMYDMIISIRKDARDLIRILMGFSESEIESSLYSRQIKLLDRKTVLLADKEKLDADLAVFGNQDVPATQQQSQKYYTEQLMDIDEKLGIVNNVIANVISRLRLYNYLVPIFAPEGVDLPNTPASIVKDINDIYAHYLHPAPGPLQPLLDDSSHTHFEYLIPSLILAYPDHSIMKPGDKKTLFEKLDLTKFYTDVPQGGILLFPTDAIITQAQEGLSNFGQFWNPGGANLAPPAQGVPTLFDDFKFEQGYLNMSLQAKKLHFNLQVNKLGTLFEYIQALDNAEDAPSPKTLATLQTLGTQTISTWIDDALNDETKRYYLCLAIYGAIPAAGYLIYQLIEHADEVGDWFEDQGSALYKGFSRRLDMFTRTDYPVNDILTQMLLAIKDLAGNFARDLLISGIMMTLQSIAEACAEEGESVNAPYSPIGNIDLASLLRKNKNTPGGNQKTEDTPSYNALQAAVPDITVEEFEVILSTFSSTFTTKELCSLLDGKASKILYKKSISLLHDIESIKDTTFISLYANEMGIKEFFKLVSRDIEPAFCAKAIDTFEKQKSLLLEMCYGRDDSFLAASICGDLPPAECLKLLANKAFRNESLLSEILAGIGNLFGDNVLPELCAEGKGLFDDSQKHSSQKIGASIFGGIEKAFEEDIARIKDIYYDLDNKVHPSHVQNILTANTQHGSMQDKKKMDEAQAAFTKMNSGDKVAVRLLSGLGKSVASQADELAQLWEKATPFVYGDELLGENQLGPTYYRTLNYDNVIGTVEGNIVLKYEQHKDPNVILKVYDNEAAKLAGDKEILSYSANKFMDLSINDRQPEKIIFGKYGVAIMQPDYGQDNEVFSFPIAEAISAFCLKPSGPENLEKVYFKHPIYLDLLNSIYIDLYNTTFKTGLFNKSEFKQLRLNKFATFEKCFLGFLNSRALNKQMQRLAEKLICYAPDSPTQGPVIVATIKIALDCVVRILTIKELMKSLFVYSIFPTELALDQQNTIYDNFISKEIEKSIAKSVSSFGYTVPNFYSAIVDTFVKDVINIMYDGEYSSKEAFSLLKNAQIGFAKQQLIHTVSDQISSSVSQADEYQMLEQALLPVEENNPTPYINLETVSYTDQIQALQNDYLTLFVNSFEYDDADYKGADDYDPINPGKDPAGYTTIARIYGQNPTNDENLDFDDGTLHWDHPQNHLHTTVDWLGLGGEEQGNFGTPESLNFDRSIARISRKPPKGIWYTNYSNLKKEFTKDVNEAVQGNINGIVLEKMIEYRSNTNFLSDMTDDQRNKITSFLKVLDHSWLMFNKGAKDNGEKSFDGNQLVEDGAASPWDYKSPRRLLKDLLYETKLIMLFPQLLSIVDSLDDPNGIWKKHVGKQIFYKMFIYNFEPDNVLEIVSLMQDLELVRDIDWAFYGKFYIDDFELLINQLTYHTWIDADDKSAGLAADQRYLGKKDYIATATGGGTPTVDMLPWEQYSQSKLHVYEQSYFDGPVSIRSSLVELCTWVFHHAPSKWLAMAGDAPGEDASSEEIEQWQSTKDALESTTNEIVAAFKGVTSDPWVLDGTGPGGSGIGNFFSMLYGDPGYPSAGSANWSKIEGIPLKDILTISTVTRLSSYKATSDLLGDDFKLAHIQAFSDHLFKNNGFIEDDPTTQAFADAFTSQYGNAALEDFLKRSLIEEKIGHIHWRNEQDDGPVEDSNYLVFPLFQAKETLPEDITVFDFFMDLHKGDYINPDWYDQFSAGGANTSSDWSLNDVLFPSEEPKDVFSYFYRFKTISSMNMDSQETATAYSYKSTWWWNILGRPVTREAILEHVATSKPGSNQPIPYTDINIYPDSYLTFGQLLDFSTAGLFNAQGGVSDRQFDYLTNTSLATLQEDHSYFFDDDGNFRTPNPGPGVQYDEIWSHFPVGNGETWNWNTAKGMVHRYDTITHGIWIDGKEATKEWCGGCSEDGWKHTPSSSGYFAADIPQVIQRDRTWILNGDYMPYSEWNSDGAAGLYGSSGKWAFNPPGRVYKADGTLDFAKSGEKNEFYKQIEPKTGIIVGHWDIKDPKTGEIVLPNVPKFIQVRSRSYNTNNQLIDWGWWASTDPIKDNFWNKNHLAGKLQNRYFGTYFHPAFEFPKNFQNTENFQSTGLNPPRPATFTYGQGIAANLIKYEPDWHKSVSEFEYFLSEIAQKCRIAAKEAGEPFPQGKFSYDYWTNYKTPGSFGYPTPDQFVSGYAPPEEYYTDVTAFTFVRPFFGQCLEDEMIKKTQEGVTFGGGTQASGINDGYATNDKHWNQGPIWMGVGSFEKEQVKLPVGAGQYNAYKLFGRMLHTMDADQGLSGTGGNVAHFKKLMEAFFLKEQTSIIAMLHKYAVEKYYPKVEVNFDKSIKTAMEALKTAIAVANGDYQYTSSSNSGEDDVDIGAIADIILQMFIRSFANTVDPTWKTPWFFPGPLTPVGMIAKAMEGVDIFKSDDESGSSAGATLTSLTPICQDNLDEQVAALNIIPDEEEPDLD